MHEIRNNFESVVLLNVLFKYMFGVSFDFWLGQLYVFLYKNDGSIESTLYTLPSSSIRVLCDFTGLPDLRFM